MDQPTALPPELPSNWDLPPYLPILRESTRKLAETRTTIDVVALIDESVKSLYRDVEQFVDFVVNENMFGDASLAAVLDQYVTTMYQLLKTQFSVELWKNSHMNSRAQVMKNMSQDKDLTLATLAEYQDITDRLPFGEYMASEFEQAVLTEARRHDFEASLRHNRQYRYVSSVGTILDNPENPLPDDQEDDDIQIAGGKVSLKDPITLQIFENPMISKKCGHIYDKHSIEPMLQTSSRCPISGCDSELTKNDLTPDTIMEFRVRVWTARQRR